METFQLSYLGQEDLKAGGGGEYLGGLSVRFWVGGLCLRRVGHPGLPEPSDTPLWQLFCVGQGHPRVCGTLGVGPWPYKQVWLKLCYRIPGPRLGKWRTEEDLG